MDAKYAYISREIVDTTTSPISKPKAKSCDVRLFFALPP